MIDIVDEMLTKPIMPINTNCTIGDIAKYCKGHAVDCTVCCYASGSIEVEISKCIMDEVDKND